MIKAVSVKALELYKILVRYNDGVEGVFDISDLAGKGVFNAWDENNLFQKVKINTLGSALTWSEDLEIDAFAIYLGLIGKSFEEWQNENNHYAAA
jgi:hypothetical protein